MTDTCTDARCAARIAIVDYEKGNLANVRRGLSDAGFDAQVTGDAAQIAAAEGKR